MAGPVSVGEVVTVVLDERPQLGWSVGQRHPHARAAGVLAPIRERLLDDAVRRQLDARR